MLVSIPVLYFDLDGVLVDSRPAIAACVNATLHAFGFARVSPESIEAIIGPPLQYGFAELLERQGGRSALAPECVAYFRSLYADAAVSGTVLQPGIRELLAAVPPSVRLAVATSKPLRFAEPILRQLAIRDAFEVVSAPTPPAEHESKTETLGRAVAAMTASPGPGEAFMVGDRREDMIAALENGLIPVGALWGFGSERELREAGAVRLMRRPSEIFELVLAHESRPDQ